MLFSVAGRTYLHHGSQLICTRHECGLLLFIGNYGIVVIIFCKHDHSSPYKILDPKLMQESLMSDFV
jgi:hypothetical protein